MRIITKNEITYEQYEMAQKKGPYTLINESNTLGYGVCGVNVSENNGKYYLEFDRNDGRIEIS